MALQPGNMCYKPITLKKSGDTVPCGRCPKCKARRISGWSFRLMQEERVCSSAHFVTLTYDNTTLPFCQTGLPSLCKRDVQLFFKRLRKLQCGNAESPIKYYTVGEYGGHTERPHYHSILFNSTPELIEAAWNNGSCHFGSVSGASVGYTMKYILKNQRKMKAWLNGRQPEFGVMSKGLGISYLNEEMINWHMADLSRMYLNLEAGKKCSMPRYYKDKMYFDAERRAVAQFYAVQADAVKLEKLLNQTCRDVWNEQQAIDAAFSICTS